MRIYFDFNLYRQALIFHEVAKYWKKHYGIKDFAGAIAVKGGSHYEFLKKQKDIIYHYLDNRDSLEKKALTEELDFKKIDEIEKKLQIPLWQFVVADRNIGHFFVKGGKIPKTNIMSYANHENIIKLISFFFNFFDRRLEEYKPDAIIFFAIASLPALILAKTAEIRGIPYYILTSIRIKNYWSIDSNNTQERFSRIKQYYNSILDSNAPRIHFDDEAIKYIDSFTKKPVYPAYMNQYQKDIQELQSLSWQEVFCRSGLKLASILKSNYPIISKKDTYLRAKKPISDWKILWEKLFFRKKRLWKLFDQKIDKNDSYVYYPLHLDPEASTMVLSPNFVNQLSIIELLAKNIPLTFKLYVKEHIPMIGLRPKDFYKEIKSYPNVKLLSPLENNFELIKNASLVAVITGTSGWEAILMGVPVITFGETFYSELGLSEKCSDIETLGFRIKNLIYNGLGISEKERQIKLKAFVSAIFKYSFQIDGTSLLWEDLSDIRKIEKEMDIKVIAEQFIKCMKEDNIII